MSPSAHIGPISAVKKLLATALVSSRLNYCDTLLYGIADLTKLQHIQNRPARAVTKSPPFTHSVPLLCFLHWLPVKFRILLKISLLTCKTLHEKQPVYLHFMVSASLPSRSLRSNKAISLSNPDSAVAPLFLASPGILVL